MNNPLGYHDAEREASIDRELEALDAAYQKLTGSDYSVLLRIRRERDEARVALAATSLRAAGLDEIISQRAISAERDLAAARAELERSNETRWALCQDIGRLEDEGVYRAMWLSTCARLAHARKLLTKAHARIHSDVCGSTCAFDCVELLAYLREHPEDDGK